MASNITRMDGDLGDGEWHCIGQWPGVLRVIGKCYALLPDG